MSGVAADSDGLVDRQATEERNLERVRQPSPALFRRYPIRARNSDTQSGSFSISPSGLMLSF